jgi:hypothetical protein
MKWLQCAPADLWVTAPYEAACSVALAIDKVLLLFGLLDLLQSAANVLERDRA